MDHAGHLHPSFPWRAATIVVGAIAAVELVALIGIGAVRLATPARAHSAAAGSAATHARTPSHRTVHAAASPLEVSAPPSHPLRARTALSVLVLNGNGVNGAAGREAVDLQTAGYGAARSTNAPRHDYARSMVLYVPGYLKEARRLGHDAGVALIAPIDGMSKSDLKGSQLVVVLGGS